MERIEVNVMTGEVKTIQLTQEEIDAFMQNPQTQIKWGLNYIEKRYGSPCEAWEFWSVNRWY